MGIWKEKATGKWKYVFQKNGKQYGGAGFRTKREAIAARECRRQEIASRLSPKNTGLKLLEVGVTYLEECERRLARKTYLGKRLAIQGLLSHIGDMPLPEIQPHMVHGYLNTLPSNNNYNAHRKDLSAMFEFAKRRLKVQFENPCADVPKMPHTPARKRIPSEADILRLISVADAEERPLLLVLLNTLGRIDEILRLRWEDVDFEKRSVTLWTRKRKGGSYEGDQLPMNDHLFGVLWSLWESRAQNEWVFCNPKTGDRYKARPRMMRGLCKRAGIEPYFGFHALRHFMASVPGRQEKAVKQDDPEAAQAPGAEDYGNLPPFHRRGHGRRHGGYRGFSQWKRR